VTLAGSVALVTGAARPRGIGRGVALALARDGADVAVNDIGEVAEDGAAVVREIEALGRRGLFVPADVSRRDQVDGMFAAVEADMGPVGIVCSNAGVADWQAVADLTPEVFRRIVDVNLTGAFHVCQAAARLMADRGGGRIVVTSSVHVQMPFPQMSVYGSTKQALRALVDHMAVELGPHAV
jgi:NAD(P)-dependent dehydrogenase (short-subunit alcohol dehydrogenase family)